MSEEDNKPQALPLTPLVILRKLNDSVAEQQVIGLCIQEYIALRSEQRTRLDSANKIINYYALVVAAVMGGLLTLFTKVDAETFTSAFQIVMLLIPLVTLPFAFTQQNEEIFVRHIGNYCDELKSQISSKCDRTYWLWEDYHNETLTRPRISRMLRFTGFFRSALLIIFSIISLLMLTTSYALSGQLIGPLGWWTNVKIPSREFITGVLMAIDWTLIAAATVVGVMMGKRDRSKGSPQVTVLDKEAESGVSSE